MGVFFSFSSTDVWLGWLQDPCGITDRKFMSSWEEQQTKTNQLGNAWQPPKTSSFQSHFVHIESIHVNVLWIEGPHLPPDPQSDLYCFSHWVTQTSDVSSEKYADVYLLSEFVYARLAHWFPESANEWKAYLMIIISTLKCIWAVLVHHLPQYV